MIVNFHHCTNEFGNFNRQWDLRNCIWPIPSESRYADIKKIEETLREYFPRDISIWYDNHLTIRFNNKEDNDYFKVLAIGGIEI